MSKLEFLSEKQIESKANDLLSQLERLNRTPLSSPIPVERLVEHILGARIIWEKLLPLNGREIAGKVISPTFQKPAMIIMNELMLQTHFHTHPFMERTALAHEAGHFHLHIDHSQISQLSLHLAEPAPSTGIMLSLDSLDEQSRLRFLRDQVANMVMKDDEHWCEWQAHTFARYLLMPRNLIVPMVQGLTRRDWPQLYELRDHFEVTISMLVVHLQKLGFAEVSNDGRIYDITPLARGQRALSA